MKIPTLAALLVALVACAAAAEDEYVCDGTVQPYRSSYVNAQVVGNIAEICVEEGAQVRAGDPLCRMASEVETKSYEYIISQSVDDTALQTARRSLEQAAASLKRVMDLGETTSEVEREHAQYQYDLVKIQVASEQHKLTLYKLLAQQHMANLDRYTVRAPFSGIVAAKLTELGETTSPLEKRLFHIVDISKVYVVARPRIERFKETSVGDEVLVGCEIYPEMTFPARITFVAPSVVPGGKSFIFKALVENPERLLKPEMKVCVDLDPPKAEEPTHSEPVEEVQ
jgi:RND family efflux transporter MFP subunit